MPLDIACEAENYDFLKTVLSNVEPHILRRYYGDVLKDIIKELPKEHSDEIYHYYKKCISLE